MCSQTEADQMETFEVALRTEEWLQLQQKCAQTFARLSGVQYRCRIARQLCEFAPVGDDDVGLIVDEICYVIFGLLFVKFTDKSTYMISVFMYFRLEISTARKSYVVTIHSNADL